MQCRLKCEKPEDIEYTMTITMSAGNWEKLAGQLKESKSSYIYPVTNLVRSIHDLLGQARKIYWPAEPSDKQSDHQ